MTAAAPSAGQRVRAALALAAIAAGALAVMAASVRARSAAALPSFGTVPSVALMDQAGRPFDPEALRGSVWIADFIFTRCSGQCPMMSAQMARLAESTDPSVRLVSFTVDPEWDRPEVLARYAAAYQAPARWQFVTGERGAVERLSREGFRLAAAGEASEAEPITHSGRLVLIDRRGAIRGYYEAQEPQQIDRLRRDVRQLLRSRDAG
jgi:protein SCO1/2